jgi:hypothetical protein
MALLSSFVSHLPGFLAGLAWRGPFGVLLERLYLLKALVYSSFRAAAVFWFLAAEIDGSEDSRIDSRDGL